MSQKQGTGPFPALRVDRHSPSDGNVEGISPISGQTQLGLKLECLRIATCYIHVIDISTRLYILELVLVPSFFPSSRSGRSQIFHDLGFS